MFDRKMMMVAALSLVIGATIASAIFFSFLHFRPTSVATQPSPERVLPSTEMPSNVTKDQTASAGRMLTYQNRQFGFQIQYPESFFAEDKGGTEPGSTIVNLVNVNKRNDEGYSYEGVYFSAIKKEKAADMYKRLVDNDKAAQEKREADCKVFAAEEFDQCAYYGGGWNHSIITMAGVEAVSSVFRGEGPREVRIYFPSKGIMIHYSDLGFDPTPMLNTFTFFDVERTIRDPKSGIPFHCPAFWTCNFNGSRYYSYGDSDAQTYLLESLQNESIELLLFSKSTEQVNTLMKKRETHFSERKKEYADALQECLAKASEENCKTNLSGMYWPYTMYSFKMNGNTVYVFQDRALGTHDDLFSFNPKEGIIIGMESNNFLLDQKFLESIISIK